MMIDKKYEEIKNSLMNFNYFQECIIEGLVFEDYLNTLKITFNNIWTKEFIIRKNLDSRKDLICIKFKELKSFIFNNCLNEYQLSNMEMINWGINEIAIITAEKTEGGYIKINILWEGDRFIEVVFNKFELIQLAPNIPSL
jgi:hypothetical protein